MAAILGRRGEPEGSGHADDGGSAGAVDPEELEARLRQARRPGLVTVPEQLRLGRLAVSTSAVVALLALVLAVGCTFVVRILWAERTAAPQALEAKPAAAPTAAVTVTGGSDGATTAPVADGVAGTGPTSAGSMGQVAEVVVHVVGQVRKPGVVHLPGGARVADALSAAGGPAKGADLAALNLARPVSDGEQVYVPKPGETVPAPPAVQGGGSPSAGTAAGGSGPGTGQVNLNTADLAALDSLPGVGPVLAQRILDWRAEHGRFSSIEELGEVSGIGEKLLARLKPKVTL
ncbi:MAG: helix-hairpin-helix domain-containing protein [Intrasporangium sp.]|uniref:helix-hairpin-helix domain-containing protein n=1 Tax=Intrasporangium sp. TaxID=1925024 RepID=UPI003F80249E